MDLLWGLPIARPIGEWISMVAAKFKQLLIQYFFYLFNVYFIYFISFAIAFIQSCKQLLRSTDHNISWYECLSPYCCVHCINILIHLYLNRSIYIDDMEGKFYLGTTSGFLLMVRFVPNMATSGKIEVLNNVSSKLF